MKKCSHCFKELALSEFYRHRTGHDSFCKACSRIKKIEWIKKNPDKVRAQDQRKYAKNKASIKARIAAWGKKNPGLRSEYCAKWDAENIDKKRSYARTRQAIRRKAIPSWANLDKIAAVYAEARNLELTTGVPHDVDHIVPLQSRIVCGLHWEGNLRAIPASMNGVKSNRHWPDMPEGAY